MKRILGGKGLLIKAKREAKRQDNKRVKRLFNRQAKRLVGKSGTTPEPPPATSLPESSN